MKKKIEDIVKTLSLEEKASLCSGVGLWQTKGLEDKGIPTIWMADGSNGIRIMKPKENKRQQATSDFLKVTDLTQNSPTITDQYEAVCYPSGAALASTWNGALIEKMGEALGDECRYHKIHLLLAPGINIKRSPLGGRGYEYYSEDPYLTGKIAEAFIKGVQSRGIGTSVKHYAANNSETLRINMSSDMDERTLREVYLYPFEMAVKNAKPWTVMSSYNKVNGVQMAENHYLLTEILRDEWGYDGVVVSDWGGVKDRVKALEAGNDLDMPENRRNNQAIVEAVRAGDIGESVLDLAVGRILELVFKAKEAENFIDEIDFDKHRQIACDVAKESIVLLKNEDDILPLTKEKYKKVAVIGAFAKEPRYQGGGCTLVNPVRVSSPYEEMVRLAGDDIEISYAQGYELRDVTNETLLGEARKAAGEADAAVIYAGLWVAYDREGFDRKHLHIDQSHTQLIEEVLKVQKNVVVVLNNGDAVTMDPWIDNVKSVVQQFLVGETVGEAVTDVLFGRENPSGKLPVTYPKRLEDTSAYPYFPGECYHHIYGEGVFVGYRYFEKKKIEPLFAFGHGLSYTKFEYSRLELDRKIMSDQELLTVAVDVRNTGDVAGKEIVQLYVTDQESRLKRPEKELKAFEKIFLKPGESKTVRFMIGERDFAYYDPEVGDWVVEDGLFVVKVGRASDDICLEAPVKMMGAQKKYRKLYLDSQHVQLFENETAGNIYLDFLVEKSVINEDQKEYFKPLLKSNYMGIYNVVTALLGGDVMKEELQVLIDRLNALNQ